MLLRAGSGAAEVEATNAKAREKVVSRGVLRIATAADDPSAVRQRALSWVDVTLEEMYVFLGVRILMGAYHRDRVVHYWHEGDDSAGMRVPLIAEAMKKDRHLEILSHLSFVLPGVTKYAGNKLQKLKEVNDLLRDNCELARLGRGARPDARRVAAATPLSLLLLSLSRR